MKKYKYKKKYSASPILMQELIIDNISNAVEFRVDELIYLKLQGYTCQVKILGNTLNLKETPNRWQRFWARVILNWRFDVL